MLINFRKNLGNIDRIIRFSIGLILISLVGTQIITGTLATIAIVLSIFQFVEAIFAY